MGLAKKFIKNVRSTKVKLSKVKAMKFKKSAAKASSIDAQTVVDNMEVDHVAAVKLPTKKVTKKQNLRKQRKAELRKCFEAKRVKSLVVKSSDAMDAPVAEQAIEEIAKTMQKINDDRVKKDTLPIKLPLKQNQLKVRAKELLASNMVSGRRMSKKKLRKEINKIKRSEREVERKAASMDTA